MDNQIETSKKKYWNLYEVSNASSQKLKKVIENFHFMHHFHNKYIQMIDERTFYWNHAAQKFKMRQSEVDDIKCLKQILEVQYNLSELWKKSEQKLNQIVQKGLHTNKSNLNQETENYRQKNSKRQSYQCLLFFFVFQAQTYPFSIFQIQKNQINSDSISYMYIAIDLTKILSGQEERNIFYKFQAFCQIERQISKQAEQQLKQDQISSDNFKQISFEIADYDHLLSRIFKSKSKQIAKDENFFPDIIYIPKTSEKVIDRQLKYSYLQPKLKQKFQISEHHYDLVFQGGGAKGITYLGAYEALKKSKFNGKQIPIRSILGSSAGAMIALAVSTGIDSHSVFDICYLLSQIAIIDKFPEIDGKQKSDLIKKIGIILDQCGIIQQNLFTRIINIVEKQNFSKVEQKLLKYIAKKNKIIGQVLSIRQSQKGLKSRINLGGLLKNSALLKGDAIANIAVECLYKYFHLIFSKNKHNFDELRFEIESTFIKKQQKRMLFQLFVMQQKIIDEMLKMQINTQFSRINPKQKWKVLNQIINTCFLLINRQKRLSNSYIDLKKINFKLIDTHFELSHYLINQCKNDKKKQQIKYYLQHQQVFSYDEVSYIMGRSFFLKYDESKQYTQNIVIFQLMSNIFCGCQQILFKKFFRYKIAKTIHHLAFQKNQYNFQINQLQSVLWSNNVYEIQKASQTLDKLISNNNYQKIFLAYGQIVEVIKKILSTVTMKQYYQLTKIELTCTSVDLDGQILRFLNHKTTPDLPVCKAIQLSGSVPIAFQAQKWKSDWGTYHIHHNLFKIEIQITGNEFIDGGLLANFPIKYFDNEMFRPIYFSHFPNYDQSKRKKKNQGAILIGFGLDELSRTSYFNNHTKKFLSRLKELQTRKAWQDLAQCIDETISQRSAIIQIIKGLFQSKKKQKTTWGNLKKVMKKYQIPLLSYLIKLAAAYPNCDRNLNIQAFDDCVLTENISSLKKNISQNSFIENLDQKCLPIFSKIIQNNNIHQYFQVKLQFYFKQLAAFQALKNTASLSVETNIRQDIFSDQKRELKESMITIILLTMKMQSQRQNIKQTKKYLLLKKGLIDNIEKDIYSSMEKAIEKRILQKQKFKQQYINKHILNLQYQLKFYNFSTKYFKNKKKWSRQPQKQQDLIKNQQFSEALNMIDHLDQFQLDSFLRLNDQLLTFKKTNIIEYIFILKIIKKSIQGQNNQFDFKQIKDLYLSKLKKYHPNQILHGKDQNGEQLLHLEDINSFYVKNLKKKSIFTKHNILKTYFNEIKLNFIFFQKFIKESEHELKQIEMADLKIFFTNKVLKQDNNYFKQFKKCLESLNLSNYKFKDQNFYLILLKAQLNTLKQYFKEQLQKTIKFEQERLNSLCHEQQKNELSQKIAQIKKTKDYFIQCHINIQKIFSNLQFWFISALKFKKQKIQMLINIQQKIIQIMNLILNLLLKKLRQLSLIKISNLRLIDFKVCYILSSEIIQLIQQFTRQGNFLSQNLEQLNQSQKQVCKDLKLICDELNQQNIKLPHYVADLHISQSKFFKLTKFKSFIKNKQDTLHLVLEAVSNSNEYFVGYYDSLAKANISAFTSSGYHMVFGLLMALGLQTDQIREQMIKVKDIALRYDSQNQDIELFDSYQWIKKGAINFQAFINKDQLFLENEIKKIISSIQPQTNLTIESQNILQKFKSKRNIINQMYQEMIEQAAQKMQRINKHKKIYNKQLRASKVFGFDYKCNFDKIHSFKQDFTQAQDQIKTIIQMVFQNFGSLINAIILQFFLTSSGIDLQQIGDRNNMYKRIIIHRLLTTQRLKHYIVNKLANYNFNENTTLEEFYKTAPKQIFINFTVLNLDTKQLEFLNVQTKPHMPVWAAVLASASLSYIYEDFRTNRQWHKSSIQNINTYTSHNVNQFFKQDNVNVKNPFVRYNTANFISSLPLELISNRKYLRELQFKTVAKSKFLGFAFNYKTTYKKSFQDLQIKRGYFDLQQMIKLLINFLSKIHIFKGNKNCNHPEHMNKAHKNFSSFFNTLGNYFKSDKYGESIQLLTESNDNYVVNTYFDKIIKLPTKLNLLEFNVINQKYKKNYLMNRFSFEAFESIDRSEEITNYFLRYFLIPYPQEKQICRDIIIRIQVIQNQTSDSHEIEDYFKMTILSHSRWNLNKYNNFKIKYYLQYDESKVQYEMTNNSEIVWPIKQNSKIFLKFYFPSWPENLKIIKTNMCIDASQISDRLPQKYAFDYLINYDPSCDLSYNVKPIKRNGMKSSNPQRKEPQLHIKKGFVFEKSHQEKHSYINIRVSQIAKTDLIN